MNRVRVALAAGVVSAGLAFAMPPAATAAPSPVVVGTPTAYSVPGTLPDTSNVVIETVLTYASAWSAWLVPIPPLPPFPPIPITPASTRVATKVRTCTSSASTCVISGLKDGSTWRLTVRARGQLRTVSTTIIVGAPGRLTALEAESTGRRAAVVSWGASLHPGASDLVRYEVRRSGTGGRTWSPWYTVGTATTWTLRRLIPGHGYRVQVRAVNSSGAGTRTPLAFTQALT